jgi:hypothetical protein
VVASTFSVNCQERLNQIRIRATAATSKYE